MDFSEDMDDILKYKNRMLITHVQGSLAEVLPSNAANGRHPDGA